MMSEWNAACGADDPVLVVPWSDPNMGARWVDLRRDPDALDEIAEADEHPALLAALRSMNGTRSPVFTAKCDAWTMDSVELAGTRDELLLDAEVAASGFSSYIDLLWRDRAAFTSRHRMAGLLDRAERFASELPYALAKLEWTLRPAVVDLEGAVAEGFAVTLYVKAVGVDATEAALRWDEALRAATRLLRSKELAAL